MSLKSFHRIPSKLYGSKVIGCSRSTIRRIRSEPRVARKRPVPQTVAQRRKHVLRIAQKETVVAHLRFRTFGSARSIKSELTKSGINVSARTVTRDLRALGAKCLVRPRVPTRREPDRQARLAFARRCLSRRGIEKLLVFSDECWLTCNERSGRTQWCFPTSSSRSSGKRAVRERPLPRETKSKWNVASVQVWAACGYGFKSDLIIFPAFQNNDEGARQAFRLNKYTYIRRCLSKIAPRLSNSRRIFLQDGARSHCNAHVKSYLDRKKIKFEDNFPAYSPDLNLQENAWMMLKERLGQLVPTTLEELCSKAKEAWASIPQSAINRMSLKYLQRLQTLTNSNGEYVR